MGPPKYVLKGVGLSEILASEDKRVKGLVLVDANIPSFFDDEEAAVIKARYEPLAGALKRDKPDVARVLIPVVQAYPATARHHARRTHTVESPHNRYHC